MEPHRHDSSSPNGGGFSSFSIQRMTLLSQKPKAGVRMGHDAGAAAAGQP
jgi:hypothetical protein